MTEADSKAPPAVATLPRPFQFTADLKDQFLIALVDRAGGKVRLNAKRLATISETHTLVMGRETDDTITLRLVKKGQSSPGKG